MPLGAHPTVVRLPDGRLRMYYSTPDALPYEPSRVRSAVSGTVWSVLDDGIGSRTQASRMEVVPLDDGAGGCTSTTAWSGGFRARQQLVDEGDHVPPGTGVSCRTLRRSCRRPARIRRWLMVLSGIEPRQRLYRAESADGLR
jgi:hypothetical protein